VSQFAWKLSTRFTAGSALRSFLLTLDHAGNVLSLSFERDALGWYERVRALEVSGVPHLFYEPLDDGKEYVWLGWQSIERPVMERLIGQPFVEADFVPITTFAHRARQLPTEKEFPASWGAMF
jgi:hypothetical protein